MSWVMVDVEADGPYPGGYSMISFGAVVVKPGLKDQFFYRLRPLPGANWAPEALGVSGYTREQTLEFDEPHIAMGLFDEWLPRFVPGRKLFISDNNGFDWQFINYYFWHFLGRNPFGYSSTNLGSLYKGLVKDTFKSFKHLRDTKHTHHPLDDAIGNAEAMLRMAEQMRIEL